jgi:putative ABC transport system permease protein
MRRESVIVAVFGTIGGLGVGVFLGWALVKAASEGTGDMIAPAFSAPITQLIVVLVVGAIAGWCCCPDGASRRPSAPSVPCRKRMPT